MAINQLKYAQRYEENIKNGMSQEAADANAVEYATKVAEVTRETIQTKKRRSPLAKAIVWGRRKSRELRYGPKTYLYETSAERKKRVALEKEE